MIQVFARPSASPRRTLRSRLISRTLALAGLAVLAGCFGRAHDVEPRWFAVALSVASVAGSGAPGATRCEGGDERRCTPVATGDRFEAGGAIEVAPGSRAVLEIDGAVLTLDGGARVELSASGARKLAVLRGTAALDGRRAAPVASLLLVTPGGEVAVDAPSATSVAVRVDDPTSATVSVQRGSVRAAAAGGPEALVRSGESLAIVAGAPASRETPLSTGSPVEGAPVVGQVPARLGAARGLGAMTARVPGTEQVVAGVRLAKHHVHAVVRDGFARTEVEEEFENSTDRVLEGRFVFPVPPGASISRLALWVGNELVEGEIVERERAARIFKGIVDDTVRPRDPALLEWVGGGLVSLKVFPIPAKGRRKIVLAYNQALREIGGRTAFVVPLALGTERAVSIDDFSVDVEVSDAGAPPSNPTTPRYAATIATRNEGTSATFSARDFVPEADFVVAWDQAPARTARVVTHVASGASEATGQPEAGTFAMRVRVDLPAGARAPERVRRERAIVVDRSHGQSAETLEQAVLLAMSIARQMDDDERFVLLACDAACDAWPEDGLAAPTPERLEAASRWLATLRPAGASDVAGALIEAARRVPGDGGGQVVYVGDGAPSAGDLTTLAIAARVEPMIRARRVDLRLLGLGRGLDGVVLHGLARSLGAVYEPVVTDAEPERRARQIAVALSRPVVRGAELTLPPGFRDVSPVALPALPLGEEIVVVGRLGEGELSGNVLVTGELGGAPYASSKAIAFGETVRHNALVPRVWAESRIAALEAKGSKESIGEAIELSRRFHVMSRHTALLVLENDRMFSEMGVERMAKKVQGDHAFGALSRMGPPAAPSQEGADFGMIGALGAASPASPWGRPVDGDPLSARGNMWGDRIGGSFGAGGLGLSGIGEGGGGRGEGIGLGRVGNIGRGAGSGESQGNGLGASSKVRGPTGSVRAGGSTVSGRLPPEVIQHVVRRQFGRMRMCYEHGLRNNPDLRGRISVRFVIGRDGGVSSASDGGSSLPDASVVACVVRAFRGVSFPAPESGIVTVVYPIAFVPSEAPPPQASTPSWSGGFSGRPSPPVWELPVLKPRASHATLDERWTQSDSARLATARDASRAAPTSRSRQAELVRVLLGAGRFEEAVEQAQRFLELDPDLGLAHDMLAQAAALADKPELATFALSSLAETEPRSVTVHQRAARAFEAAGDERRACAHWRAWAEVAPAAEDARHESLRCRARTGDDRAALLEEARRIEKPGPRLAKLVEALGSGGAPAFEGDARPGSMEVRVECAAGVERCPVPIVITPASRVVSPWTGAGPRGAVVLSSMSNGTYRTLLAGGSPDARGEVRVRALGATRTFQFTRGGRQSIASTIVTGIGG